MDIAQRIHNQNYHLDPFVRSLLDTDFYKLLMAGFIWRKYRDVTAVFKMKNRSIARQKLADIISEQELRAQLDYVRGCALRKPN